MSRTSEAVRRLACAAGAGDLDALRSILRQDPAAARDWRPIMEASHTGCAAAVDILLAHRADVDAVSSSERNRPLHRAAEQGHEAVVETLLDAGADTESRGTWLDVTPLVSAAFRGRERIVDLLIQRGARVDRFSAAAIGETSKAKQGVDSNSLTALHYCAGSTLGRPSLAKIAERLLGAGADPFAKAVKLSHAVTPLKLAARNRPVAELLLDRGADPNDLFRDVVLASACGFDFAESLLTRGAVLNPMLSEGESLLHAAIHWGHLGSAQWLLTKGADPNTARDKDGWTPLHQAASRGVTSVVAALIEHGADLRAKDHLGLTPLEVARQKRRSAVVELLTPAAHSAR